MKKNNLKTNKKIKNKKILFIFPLLLLIISIILISYGIKGYISYKYDIERKYYNTILNKYDKLFDNNIPKDKIKTQDINKIRKELKDVKPSFKKEKKELNIKLNELENYYNLKKEFDKVYNDNILKSNTSINIINELESKTKKISVKYRKLFEDKITDMKEQRKNLDIINESVNKLYSDKDNNIFRNNITREELSNIEELLKKIKQNDIKEKYSIVISDSYKIILKREEEERRKREEEERRRKEEIERAWIRLNINYISQNKNNILNGCEVATLLMALQYKGYLLDKNIKNLADNIPKSNDPNLGFTYDIYTLEPKDKPHWVAPSALSKFGKDYSNYENILDTTGYSLDELNKELENNNPVIIYTTSKFKQPKEIIDGAPKNLHVQLLAGYNKITGEQYIIDPWTDEKTNSYTWTLSKEKLENIYNQVGRKSVVVR